MIDPATFKAARLASGLSQAEWAYALGYRLTSRDAARRQSMDMESGRKAITPMAARLAEMFRRHGVPEEWQRPSGRGTIEEYNG